MLRISSLAADSIKSIQMGLVTSFTVACRKINVHHIFLEGINHLASHLALTITRYLCFPATQGWAPRSRDMYFSAALLENLDPESMRISDYGFADDPIQDSRQVPTAAAWGCVSQHFERQKRPRPTFKHHAILPNHIARDEKHSTKTLD
jgi:hypothetical protein